MRNDALKIFTAGVRAVQPQYLLPKHMRWQPPQLQLGEQLFKQPDINKVFVIGAGKASAAMARETEIILGNRLDAGIIVTKYEHTFPLKNIQCIEAAHPVPDDNSVQAGREIMRLLKNATEKDVVIALISGGASALLVDCPPGILLNELQIVFNRLLQCGATIEEMNTVRKHLSAGIKGGQLLRTAWPATVVSFILSDVIGDPLDSIASGPTVADRSTFADAWEIVRKYQLLEKLPVSVIRWLQLGLNNQVAETPKPVDPIFTRSFNYLIGTNRVALEAAAAMARELHYTPVIVTDSLKGEAREKAQELVAQVQQYEGPRPACLLLGGETTVTIKNPGKGGRNQEFALAALIAMQQAFPDRDKMPVLLSAGTDGTDGPTNAAGAIVDKGVLQLANQRRLSPEEYLTQNDSWNFFHQAGGHVTTGPTHTNVMDIIVVLIP
ncbi:MULTISPECIES: glycerate kinase type-2 family protein [Niastella]|uniref:Glycerate kinase n=1 Tax=Niastella soli TaxID=2821487 RepID=A0ABS3YS53_9BACT|nr:glycerate kinase [Niastella soli]MBO9200746.1 glycerate kinase [Niastella soli]